MKLFVKSLGLGFVFVWGYVIIVPLILAPFASMGLFTAKGRYAYEFVMAPMTIPGLIYQYLWPPVPMAPARVSIPQLLLPLGWFLGLNIIIYSLPAYLLLSLRAKRKLP